jgi:chromosome segregation ATPase
MLIYEGENMMQELRSEAQVLQHRFTQSEAEAYTSRQQVEEISDQKKSVEERHAEVEATLSNLNETVVRQESQVSVLQSDLNRARAECYALKENSIETRDKMRRATRDGEKAAREKEMAVSELGVLKRKISNLESFNSEQKEENDRLVFKLRSSKTDETNTEAERAQMIQQLKQEIDAKNQQIEKLDGIISALKQENTSNSTELNKLKESSSISRKCGDADNAVEVDKLCNKIDQLSEQIKQKDKRLNKLEKVRLTRDQLENIRQLKADNINFERQCAKLTKEKSALQSQFASVGTDSALMMEVSELRFDKKALESKLRKFAGHCQRLEDAKAGMADALRSCNIELEHDGDINEAIISVCDKLASLEEANSRGTFSVDSDHEHLQRENNTLQTKLQRLTESEDSLISNIAERQTEIEELKKTMKTMEDTNDDASGVKSEMSRKLRFLEQENLQLMLDVKTTKKQLQVAREELEMLRMNAVDNSTIDFGTVVDLGTSDTIELTDMMKPGKKDTDAENRRSRSSADSSKKRTVTSKGALAESTNIVDKVNCAPGTKRQRITVPDKTKRKVAAPGLGEPAVQAGDDTGDCKQS